MRTIKDHTKVIEKSCRELNGKKVQVGCDWANAWLAGIHEYGCDIPVTDKMRAFLHHEGIHLKASTTVIHIPERAFLRTGHDTNIDEVLSQCDMMLDEVLDGSVSVKSFCNATGQILSTKIKEHARSGNFAANSPLTIERKGSSTPLIDTGTMIESIGWEVK